MVFKKSEKNNLKSIMEIIRNAREEMGKAGIDQWQDGYPDERIILEDIEKGESYIYEKNREIVGTAVISFRKEKDYKKIENGKWLTTDDKYCVIHRIAVNSKLKKRNIGTEILKNAEKICIENKIYSIKIDTHENNEPMKGLLRKNGFVHCGIIYLGRSNEKRIAFEKILKESQGADMKFETKAIHGTEEKKKEKIWGSTINMASTFPVREFGKEQEFEYGRVASPTRSELEKTVATLENGKSAYGFSSGMAAITSIFTMFKSGDHIILGTDIYGGTYRIITDVFGKYNLEYTFTDTTDLKKVEEAIRSNTVAIFIETPSNPLLDVTDIRGIVKIAKKHNLLTIADNTFMTPYLQRPLDLGVDIVVHSATKFLSGHHDIIAGIVAVNNSELAEKMKFSQTAVGALISPFDSWLLMRSLKTLKVRVEEAQKNTLKLVEFFENHSEVEKVYFPTGKNNKGKKTHESQAEGGGAVFSFVLKNEKKVKTFFENLKVAIFAASLGGVETLVTHPSSITHAEMPEEEKNARGFTNSLIRVAVGIENIDDLIEDFKQALEK